MKQRCECCCRRRQRRWQPWMRLGARRLLRPARRATAPAVRVGVGGWRAEWCLGYCVEWILDIMLMAGSWEGAQASKSDDFPQLYSPAAAWALLRADADAALAADDDGFMPHHLAAYGGHADVLSMLLASGPPWLASMPSFDGGWTAGERGVLRYS